MEDLDKFICRLEQLDTIVDRLDNDIKDIQDKNLYGSYALNQKIGKLEKKFDALEKKLDTLFNTVVTLHSNDFIKKLSKQEENRNK